MKTLETMKEEIIRFRCDKCMSKFEMTEQELEENDWTYGEHKKGGEWDHPHNPLNWFYCPVCGMKRTMNHKSIHRYFIMDNGREVQIY